MSSPALCMISQSIEMMHVEGKSFCLADWPNSEIDDSYGSCIRHSNWSGSNFYYDPMHLLPNDPFEMNLEATLFEKDLGTKISAAIAGWIGGSNDDYEVNDDAFIADLSYCWSKAVLSSFETQLNPGSYVMDYCNKGFPGSDICVDEDGGFGAVGALEQVTFAGKSSIIHPCEGGIKLFSGIEEWVVDSNDDSDLNGGAFVADLRNYWNKEVLSLFESQLNLGSYAVDFCNKGFSRSCIDVVNKNGSFGAAVSAEQVLVVGKSDAIHSSGDVSSLHDGLILSLGYLGVQDLLSVERVCKSFHIAVQSDPLLWRCIHIDFPLNEKITDHDLYQLTQRAQGSLQCLSLIRCPMITDDGLKRVLCSNPRLKKLIIPGCLRLSVNGLIDSLKALKLLGVAGIKTLKLGRLFIASPEEFDELRSLVGQNEMHQSKAHKLKFYHVSPACDDDCAIDIEACPVCQRCRLVFDCPLESCRRMGPENCRACNACIPRCVLCGRCINNSEYVETFCLESVCLDCWKNTSQSEDELLDCLINGTPY